MAYVMIDDSCLYEYAFIRNRLNTSSIYTLKEMTEEAKKTELGFVEGNFSAYYNPTCSYLWNYAFYSCTALTSINLPVCSYVRRYAFYSCSLLTTIDLPLCSYIGSDAFTRCSALISVILPVCSYIGSFAFQKCTALTSLYLNSVTSITFLPYLNAT